jgi:drug/metabolite transporter (DMT)-like permease
MMYISSDDSQTTVDVIAMDETTELAEIPIHETDTDNLLDSQSTTTIAIQEEEVESTIQNTKQQQEKSNFNTQQFVIGVIANLLSHLFYGTESVNSRYLQKKANLPTLSIVVVGHALALFAYSPVLFYRLFKYSKKKYNSYKQQEQEPSSDEITKKNYDIQSILYNLKELILGNWLIIVWSIVTMIRVCFIVAATSYTAAVFVQLIALCAPFLTAIFGFLFLREKMSKTGIIALIFIVVGGVLVILGGFNQNKQESGYKFYWTINFSAFAQNFELMNLLGMLFAFLSTLCLVVSTLMVRAAAATTSVSTDVSEESTSKLKKFLTRYTKKYSSEDFFLAQMISVSTLIVIPSLIFEDWSVWLQMKPIDCGMMAIRVITISILATQLGFIGIQRLGAANATSILAVRLISALALSGFVLGEWLNNIWQIVGSVVVIVTVTSFLLIQAREQRLNMKK